MTRGGGSDERRIAHEGDFAFAHRRNIYFDADIRSDSDMYTFGYSRAWQSNAAIADS